MRHVFHVMATLALLSGPSSAGAQDTPARTRPAGGAVSPSTAPSAADVGADTLSLKQALEPVLHDVRPADAGVAAAGRMIVTEALAGKPGGSGGRCLENPLPRAYRIDGSAPVDAVPVSVQARDGRYRFKANLLLTVPPGGEPPEVFCIPDSVALAEGKRISLTGVDQQRYMISGSSEGGTAVAGALAGFTLRKPNGRTLSLADVFGSPLEELRQVFITSVPQGARVLDGSRPTRHHTDRVLALTDTDLSRIILEVNGRRARVKDCELRPVTSVKAEAHYHCVMGN